MPAENTSATATRAPKRGKKYFTVGDANRALCYVSRVVDDITDSYRSAVDIRQQLEHPEPDSDSDELRKDYERSMDHLNNLIEELQQVGVELKDFEKGLLDFPAIHQGREIYLCWRRGETTVHSWHEVGAGFAGRQDVTLLEEPVKP